MDWKEKLDKQGFIVVIPNGRHASKADLELKYFISKEIIDKLINDIPDRATVKYRDIEGNESPNFDIRRLKQQLRDKWL